MEPGLDLKSSIRPGLDILGNEIIIALKKRSRLPANPQIYAPGLVRQPDTSLLDYELARVGGCMRSWGVTPRITGVYTDVSDVTPVIERAVPLTHSGYGEQCRAARHRVLPRLDSSRLCFRERP